MAESNTLLDVQNLKMYFKFKTGSLFNRQHGYIYAVDDVSFSIKKGETLGLVGESGCGKSTTLRAISRLHEPTSGKVYLNGTDITKLHYEEMLKARRNMQIVFQDPYASLNPRMTTRDIIAEPMKIFMKEGLLKTT
ncbi:MAG TPA: ATP-binding cassette domain-containing protein, partial [Spirochaetales bacterium]|nr:ATP-binding cassette domain-containing protein [Spirochaetales bacterium]